MDEIQSVTKKVVGIIDCGSNTFNLLVAEIHANGWNALFENKIGVKLGSGSFENGLITSSRFIRGVDAVLSHSTNAKNFGCEKILGFATSAVRDAKNGVDFVRSVNKVTGVDIRVLNGDEEAEFIYLGIRQTLELGEKPSLMMDIGGGSVEFIIANSTQIFWKQSFQLGVSRLQDMIKPVEKLSTEGVQQLKAILEKHLVQLQSALQKFPCKRLIGSSGSFDTISSLHFHNHKLVQPEGELINEIPLSSFAEIHKWLLGSTLEERLKHPVIPELRAEYMSIASYLVHHILALQPFEKMLHSSYSLKEGVMTKFLLGNE